MHEPPIIHNVDYYRWWTRASHPTCWPPLLECVAGAQPLMYCMMIASTWLRGC